jgi:glutathione S-transferase
MSGSPRLISHKLCPYVQRAVIALTEKGVPFERVDLDLANKPDWFLKISPLGRTPVLQVGDTAIFESAVILEYLEETRPKPLHPADPLRRAEHRGWIELAQQCSTISPAFIRRRMKPPSRPRPRSLKRALHGSKRGLWLRRGSTARNFRSSMPVFGPVFRYFDVFDEIGNFGILENKPKLARWRASLVARPSVKSAVSTEYPALLRVFLKRRNSWMSQLQAQAA